MLRMARQPRPLFPHALYHLVNRGNYRRDVFTSTGTRSAFLEALAEACTRHHWRVHAYVIMRNHFHLALETPEPNLSTGMHWLLGTFANRFNRLRGHLFQGRFSAQLIEDVTALGRVVDYIHLNPVRAALVAAAGSFAWSSLAVLPSASVPVWLVAEGIWARFGTEQSELAWSRYAAYLAAVAASQEMQEQLGFPTLSRGWVIGTESGTEVMARRHAALALSPGV